MDGERSGLFLEQLRLIKEMRDHDERINGRTGEFIRPRYMVWENVTGSFSSNNGEDFRCVLQETINIVDSTTNVPRLPKGEQWSKSGAILGDGWSIAWRVHDAQFWGVPQRRKRISLVADFGGQSAPKILFESKSEYRDSEQSKEEKQDTSTTIRGSFEETSGNVKSYGCNLKDGDITGDVSPALTTKSGNASTTGGQVLTIKEDPLADNKNYVPYISREDDSTTVCATLCYDDYKGSNNQYVEQGKLVLDSKLTFRKTGHPQNSEEGQGWEECDINDTLNVTDNSETRTPTLVVDQGAGKSACNVSEDITPTLTTTHGGEPVIYKKDQEPVLLESNQNHATIQTDGVCTTLTASMGMGGGFVPMITDSSKSLFENHGLDGRYTGPLDVAPICMAGYGEGGTTKPLVVHTQDAYGINSFSETKCNDNPVYKADISKTLDRASGNPQCNQGGMVVVEEDKTYQEVTGCLSASGYDKLGTQEAANDMYVANPNNQTSIVRRLTPLECTRLQGFPDGWCDIGDWYDTKGKLHKDSDSVKYKALGNSIALPFWKWMAKRMVSQYPSDYKPTMASLFSGIGGFELSYLEAGCKPIWSSEVEEFCIAVTKKHFGDDTTGEVGDLEKFYENQ